MSVYLMQQTNGGPIKIGHAYACEARRDTIAKMFPYGAEIIAMIDGDLVTERFLHKCFAPIRVQTEWFRNCLPLWRFIAHLEDYGKPEWLPVRETHGEGLEAAAIAEFGSRKNAMQALGYADSVAFAGAFEWRSRANGGHGASRLLFSLALRKGVLPSYIRALHPAPDMARAS